MFLEPGKQPVDILCRCLKDLVLAFLQKMDLLAAINDYNNALKNKHFIACL